jgi:tetratricopeptide (TPR) repeat protein
MNRPIHGLAIAMLMIPGAAAAQMPQKFENLQVFPKDISSPQLIQRMREFSLSLAVRCEYCHEQKDANTPPNFASDARPAKQKAREMLRMVDAINGPMLAKLPVRAEPPVTVECATCHRGLAIPKTLQTSLFEITMEKGAAAAIERYRERRRDQLETGRWNFGEWETNEVGRRLAEAGKLEDAIAIFEMNAEFHPKSASIDFSLGELHVKRGDREKAMKRFQMALEKEPKNPMIQRRLKELQQP